MLKKLAETFKQTIEVLEVLPIEERSAFLRQLQELRIGLKQVEFRLKYEG